MSRRRRCHYLYEPQLFLDPMEVVSFISQNKMRLVHTQVMPQDGETNIIYGRDWKRNSPAIPSGVITILAQKK